ncbi:MAG: hypothetical protein LC739_04995 [Actinobacteria bacterium]|nr:hypothetical protein [Actinomycetota bacterium]
MRRWLIRGWLVLIGVTLLMLIPGVALADNCAGGGLSDCANSAAAAAKIAAGVGAAAAGGILLAGGSSSGSGSGSGNGTSSGSGGGDASQAGEDVTRGTHEGANPPEPSVSDQIWKEIKDFVRAQKEGISDFVEGVKDVGEEMKHELAEEIAEDFREDPTDRYKDN